MIREPDLFTGQGDLTWLPGFLARQAIPAKGVLHIGAHKGEEVRVYDECGFGHIVLVEPNVQAALRMQLGHPHVEVVALAVDDVMEPTIQPFRIAANSMQSALGGAGPDEFQLSVATVSLAYLRERYWGANVLVVDTSGTELNVLASGRMNAYDAVIVETDDAGVHASRTEHVREYMYTQGYGAVERWTHGPHAYGDEVYVRER